MNPEPTTFNAFSSRYGKPGRRGGNLVTDARIAAIALENRASVHTADRDFMRFPGLTCHYPLA